MADVQYDQATRIYPGTEIPAVNGLDLHIADGEFMVLVGPSGSGKTTALRMLAGLEEVDAGEIRIGDRDVTDLAPKDRDIAMVFQNYALYPYLTVADNIGFPLRIAKVPKAERQKRVAEVAERLGLTEYLHRKPSQLSGGQRQRVAMGRAIIRLPSVFLMDEPLSNLDAKLRVQMRADIAAMQADLGVTTVYVTHDQSEAMTLGHRVAALKDGYLQQCDTPRAMYDRPVNTFVAGFIGSPAMNLCTVPVRERSRLARLGLGAAAARRERACGGRARAAPRGARARARRARRPRSRSSRSSAPTRSPSASLTSAGRGRSWSRASTRGELRRAAIGSRCARIRPRRTASTRTPAPACQTDGVALGRPVAVGAGGLLVAAGVLGFVPGVTTHVGSLAFAGHGSHAELFGQFRVSVLLNLVHIASGLPAAVLARTDAGRTLVPDRVRHRVPAALGARAADARRLGAAEHRRQLAASRHGLRAARARRAARRGRGVTT